MWGWGEAAAVSSVTIPLGAIIMTAINKWIPSKNGKGCIPAGTCPDPAMRESIAELKTNMKNHTESMKELKLEVKGNTEALNGIAVEVGTICGALKKMK